MNSVTDTTTLLSGWQRFFSRYARYLTMGFWLYAALILLGHLVGFPLSYAYLHTVCTSNCALTPDNLRALTRANLSIDFYANSYMVLQTIYILVGVSVATLIVMKKPGRLVPLGAGLFLVGLSAYEGGNYPTLTTVYPFLSLPAFVLINVIGMGPLSTYVLLTFPNGKFTPRWVLWVFLGYVIEGLLEFILPHSNNLLGTIFGIIDTSSFFTIVFILIYRSRTVLNPKERNAAKWLIYSFSVFIIMLFLVLVVFPAIIPGDSLWSLFLMNTLGFFGCGINILGLLMAILYANAFDIDVLINRTLVYVSLTAILLGVYLLLVFTGQHLLVNFVGRNDPVILVISTLLVAALFQPLRRGLQNLIDRRFYRQKYDAARVLSAFSATLQREIELEQLSERLVTVIEETMQPAHISLWLCQPRARSQEAPDT